MALYAYDKLKDKKKFMILSAIGKCLKEQMYDEISVNHIAYEAGIARGSFYNYFEDKYDAVYTFIEAQFESLENTLKESVIKCNGDLFEGIKLARSLNREFLLKDDNLNIAKNIDFLMGVIIKIIYSEKYTNEVNNLLDWLIENTNEGKKELNNKEVMANTLELIVALLQNELVRLVTNNHKVSLYEDFDFKLKIIKLGVANLN